MSDWWSAVNAEVRELWAYIEALGADARRALEEYRARRRRYQASWPPPEAVDRLARYARYRAIYEGRHEEVYVTHGPYSYDEDRPYVSVNIAGELVDLLVSRLFGEFPRVGIDDPDARAWVESLIERSRWQSDLPGAARGASYRGDAALKVRVAAGQVLIQPVNPGLLLYDTDPDDTGRIIRATQGWVLWEDDQAFLRLEIHTAGRIENELYRLHPAAQGTWGYNPDDDALPLDTLATTTGLEPSVATGVDELLIVPIAAGNADDGEIWGRSDLADVDALQGELNNRETQRAEILDRHADPYIQGPPQLISNETDAQGRRKLLIDPQNRYIATERPEEQLSYLTWDAELAAVENQIRDLRNSIVLVAGFSPESLQLSEQAAAESGRALKLRQHRTAATVREWQSLWDRALRQAVSLASRLALSPAVQVSDRPPAPLAPTDVRFVWEDGLPDDTMQRIEEEALAVQVRVSSRKAAIMRLYKLSAQAADDELAAIAAEEQQMIGSAGGPDPSLGSTIVGVEPERDTGITDENAR